MLIGCDGCNSAVARAALPEEKLPFVAAYHEVVESPPEILSSGPAKSFA